MSNYEATQVIGAAGAPTADRTMVVPGGIGAPMPGGADAFRTQMGGTTTCPVCKSTTPLMEPYCGDCGFLLTSPPAEELSLPSEEAPVAELVDLQDGRRFRLRMGVNTVGRQGTDVLVNDGTVSRNHATITISDSGITVEDLGSSNGTKVGDLRLGANQPTNAAPGTPLRFGNWRVMLEKGGVGAGSAEATVMVGADDRTLVGAPPTDDRTMVGTPGGAAASPVAAEAAAPIVPEGPVVAWLRKEEGPGADIAITEGTLTIGRRTGNTLVLTGDNYISGRHAELTTNTIGTYLTDVGSTNGTGVNGQKLTPNERQPLLEGDIIQLGQTRYRFEEVAPAAEAPEPAPVENEAEAAPSLSGEDQGEKPEA
ncbi:MAG TPA: FHA domain-containing protein [Chthonomonadaceae bacterium]|nr:FHA domain-containing protein [Chthonomonadaceae bacterium]